MAPLKNKKHELLANNIVKNKFNLTKSYQETFPNSSYAGANSHVHDVVKRSEVKERIDEIANRKGLTVEFEIDSILNSHSATRPVVVDKNIIDYPDYAIRLEAAKTGLKLHGFLNSDSHTINNIDARSVNIGLDNTLAIALNKTLAELNNNQIDNDASSSVSGPKNEPT